MGCARPGPPDEGYGRQPDGRARLLYVLMIMGPGAGGRGLGAGSWGEAGCRPTTQAGFAVARVM